MTLVASQIDVQSVRRQVPDFGNRILVSGDGAVAGLSVQVVPLADDDACVVADGVSAVRLIAIVLGADGLPVALGTEVTWSASSGYMSALTSQTAEVVRQGEVHKADDYTHLTLDLPAERIVGVYRRQDVRRARNYYMERDGSVSGRVITFSAALDYYDQTLVVDYVVKGAPITWTSGRIPGDVTVLGSVAGAQGYCTLHQSNPTACATQISMEASPSSPCLGDTVAILLKATMFGGAGVGAATFGIQGCGSLSSTRKTLQPRTITETLRTSIWGGAAEVRLSAVPVAGTTPSVVLTETPGGNLYASHSGQTVILTDPTLLPGTQVTVTYVAGGIALVSWIPSALPTGYETVTEVLPVTHAEVGGITTPQVTLTRTPMNTPVCEREGYAVDHYVSHTGKLVTLDVADIGVLPVGQLMDCTYQAVWSSRPGCPAIITVRVDDGSEDGGRGQLSLTARDCRTVNPGSTDPDEIPDEVIDEGETDAHDPTSWLEPEEPEDVTATSCLSEHINARTPTITADNHAAVFGVESGENCPGNCTCDEICAALRSTGRLSREGGMTWSICMDACAAARAAKCTPCVLTGPSTLNPGEEGLWDDGKGNLADVTGGNALTFVSKSEAGYVLKMPTGGQGPFTIRVCYGEEESDCCEAEVDFPPCSLSGVTELDPGVESLYLPSAGMEGAACTCSGDMEFVRLGAYGIGFICRMKIGGCQGTVTIAYGGRVCGVITVNNPKKDYVGSVAGPNALEQGESAIFYHNLGPGAEYIGSLPGTPFENELGNGFIGTMDPSAADGQLFTVEFRGPCNSLVAHTVTAGIESCDDIGSTSCIGAFPGTGGYFHYGGSAYVIGGKVATVTNAYNGTNPCCTWGLSGDKMRVRNWTGCGSGQTVDDYAITRICP
ncbi:MAG: Ig-like domain-containing protein [Desulfomicrobium sp.]